MEIPQGGMEIPHGGVGLPQVELPSISPTVEAPSLGLEGGLAPTTPSLPSGGWSTGAKVALGALALAGTAYGAYKLYNWWNSRKKK
jgi:hypothetical protein